MTADALSRVFSALADPTRRDIVARLAAGDATVNELAELRASVQRTLLVDSPLNPMRTGRQPQVEDRRPLTDF